MRKKWIRPQWRTPRSARPTGQDRAPAARPTDRLHMDEARPTRITETSRLERRSAWIEDAAAAAAVVDRRGGARAAPVMMMT